MAVKNLYESAITGVTGDNDIVIDSDIDFNDDNETDFVTFLVLSNYEVSIGDEINYYDYTNTLLFAGIVRKINNNNPKEILVFKYDILLSDRIVNETLENYTVEGLIEYIVDTYSSLTFSSTFVSGITIPRYPAKDIRALEIIRDVISLVPSLTYNVTNLKVFEVYLKGSQSSGITLINGNNCAVLGGWDEDTSKQVTRLILYGEQQVSKDTIDLFSGDGSSDTFTLTEIPNNILVEVDSGSGFVKQELKVEGQTTGDFILNKESKKIIFQSGSIPIIGTNNIRVTYDFSINIRVEFDADKTIQDKYFIIEKKITKSYLNTDDSAFDYASQYIDKFQEPLLNARIQKLDSISLSNLRIGYSINCIDNINTINNNNINERLIIRRITRKFTEGSLIISVGEVGADTIDILSETKYNVRQLYDKNNNSSINTKSQLLTNKVKIKVKTELEQLKRTLPDNYLYLFNEIEGLQLWIKGDGDVLDYSGNGNNGTWTGTEQYATGKQFDYAMDFDGSSYITCSVPSNVTNEVSLSIDIYPTTTLISPDYEILVTTNTWWGELTIIREPNNSINFSFSESYLNARRGAAGSININEWTNLLLVGNLNSFKGYINGVEVISVTDIISSLSLTTFKIGGDSTSSRTFVGKIGDVRLYNKIIDNNAISSIHNQGLGLTSNCNIAEVGNGEDRRIGEEIGNLAGWWKLDGDALDYSGNSNNGTWSGTEAYDIGKQFDLAGKFNGTDAYIRIPHNDIFNLTNDFSIFIWAYPTVRENGTFLVTKTVNTGATNTPYDFRLDSNGQLELVLSTGATYQTKTSSFLGGVTLNEWALLGFTLSSGNINFYYNNTVSTPTAFSITATTNSEDLLIASRDDLANYSEIYLQDVRIYNKVLSTNERTALYNEGLGLLSNSYNELSDGTLGDNYLLVDGNVWNNNPDDELPNLEAYYSFENQDATDDSGNGNTGTLTDVTFTTGKIGTYSASFNGSSSYIKINHNPSFNFGIEDFTISGYIKYESQSSKVVIDKGYNTGNATRILIFISSSNLRPFYSGAYRGVGKNLSDGEWHHFAFVRKSESVFSYFDGSLFEINSTLGAGTSLTNSDNLIIGQRSDEINVNFFDGQIDEVRIVSREMSSDEIKAIYNKTSANKYNSWDNIE